MFARGQPPSRQPLASRPRPAGRRTRRARRRRSLAWRSSIHGRKSAGCKAGNVRHRLVRSPLGSITSAGRPAGSTSSIEHDAEAGLARAGHADDHAVGRQVVGVDAHVVAGAVVRRRIDLPAQEQLSHGRTVVDRPVVARSSSAGSVTADSPYRAAVLMRRVTAGMVGFVGLTLEIAYTRIVSFKLFYYYTYFVIGLALLGFGAAATVTALSDRLRRRDVLDTVRILAPVVAAARRRSRTCSSPGSRPTSTRSGLGFARAGVFEFLVVIVLALALTAVFFGLGAVISLLIVVDAADVRRLYFWDLAGAALGCLLAVPLQRTIGPPAMVLLSLVAFAGARPRRSPSAAATALRLREPGLALTAVAAFVTGSYDVRTDDTKTLELSTTSAKETGVPSSASTRVDLGDLQILHHDGLWGSSIWRYDGTPRDHRPVRHRRPPDPVGGARSHAGPDPDHRRRRRQRDPGGADLRRRPGRRGRAQPGHPRPADRHVRRVLGQHRQPAQRQLRAGRRTHVPRPLATTTTT